MKDIDLSFEFIDDQDRFIKSTIKKNASQLRAGKRFKKRTRGVSRQLGKHLSKILGSIADWANTVVLNKNVKDVRADKCRKGWSKLDVLNAKVKQG